jgi:hypothetical protein
MGHRPEAQRLHTLIFDQHQLTSKRSRPLPGQIGYDALPGAIIQKSPWPTRKGAVLHPGEKKVKASSPQLRAAQASQRHPEPGKVTATEGQQEASEGLLYASPDVGKPLMIFQNCKVQNVKLHRRKQKQALKPLVRALTALGRTWIGGELKTPGGRA